MSIQDKQYKEIIKSNYNEMIYNYKERLNSVTFVKYLEERIKSLEKEKSPAKKSPIEKSPAKKSPIEKSPAKNSPTGVLELI